jgi:hypothetical protein
VADDRRIARRFFEDGQEIATQAHGDHFQIWFKDV